MSSETDTRPVDAPGTAARSAPPFDHLRVLDLSRVFAGPYATQLLGDLGADVLKVEHPGGGDAMRTYGPPYLRDRAGAQTREGPYYLAANRNKRSVTIDLSTTGGQDLVRQLAATADVLVENFKVGDLARYGLDYECIRRINPRIVYCSVTGFGQTGPYRRRPALDGTIQALSGLMAQTGEPDGPPQRNGVIIVDLVTALYAANAIAAALYRRDARGSEGEYIDLSMLDVGVSMLSHRAQHYLISGEQAPRTGRGATTGMPAHVFDTADGAAYISANQDDQFARFCHQVIDRPDLARRYPTYADRMTHRDDLGAAITEIVASRPTSHWVDRCDRHNIVCSPVNDIVETLADPQVAHRDLVVRAAHRDSDDLRLLRNPIRYANTPLERYDAPPVAGQHTREALADWLDLDEPATDDLIAKLTADGAL